MLDTVVAATNSPEHRVLAGDVGAVVEVYHAPALAYEVEFVIPDGSTRALLTLAPSQVRRARPAIRRRAGRAQFRTRPRPGQPLPGILMILSLCTCLAALRVSVRPAQLGGERFEPRPLGAVRLGQHFGHNLLQAFQRISR
jgi:hypothetical protein